MPDLLRLPENLRGIAPAALSRPAPHTPVVPQQCRPHIVGSLEVAGKDAGPVADVCFDLEQIVGVAVEHAGVEPHHLHQSDRTPAADRRGAAAFGGMRAAVALPPDDSIHRAVPLHRGVKS